MKTRKLLWTLSVITALLLITVPASAGTTRTPVNATEYVCLKTPGEEWVDGNVFHVRGQINENVVVVDGEIWGINTASIDFDFNLKTGQIVGRGFADFVPLGASGGYSGVGFFRFVDSGATMVIGVGSLQGYGEFKGQSMHLADMESLPPDPAGAAFCAGHGPHFGTTLWNGYILSPD